MTDSKRDETTSRAARAAAGDLAAGVVSELVRPLRELREDLAVLVEFLDRHISDTSGPKGLSYKEVETLRQQVADGYLRSRKLARIAGELADAVSTSDSHPASTNINKLVESALNLSRHRVAESSEVFVDLGSVPPVRVIASELLIVVCQLIATAADSARGVDGGAISIKTRLESDVGENDHILIAVVDNGRGCPDALEALAELVDPVVARIGGSFSSTSETGKGSAFEIHLPTAPVC